MNLILGFTMYLLFAELLGNTFSNCLQDIPNLDLSKKEEPDPVKLKLETLYQNSQLTITISQIPEGVESIQLFLNKSILFQKVSVTQNHSAMVRLDSARLKPSEKYCVNVLFGEGFRQGNLYSFKTAIQIPPRRFSLKCNRMNNYIKITFTHLREGTIGYNIYITHYNDPQWKILCNKSVDLAHQVSQTIHIQFKSKCFQCGHRYYVTIETLNSQHKYRTTSLFIPCNPTVLQGKTENLCGSAKTETSVHPATFSSPTYTSLWTPSPSTLLMTTASRSTAGEVPEKEGHTGLWIIVLLIFIAIIFCLIFIFRYMYISKITQKQQGLIISFPQPMEHCAATKELTIILNSYTSLHVRSSHEMKLKENQSLKKQIQQVYDNFNTFIIIHSDGLYYHNQNQETNGIGYEMADFTIELVKFCTRDDLYQSKNIYHVTFDEDSSKFEYSELCSGPQDNMYYLYRPNVLGNNGLDLNQIENLFCDINDQQAVIQPSRYHVKFQMNWKESREIQNLNDALVFQDDRQRMFPHWYTDMFPKSEVNENLSNFNLDKISKVSDFIPIEEFGNDAFGCSRLYRDVSISNTVSDTNTDQISVFLERINKRNN